MSDTQVTPEQATEKYESFMASFTEETGYQVVPAVDLTPDGRLRSQLQLIKAPAPKSTDLTTEDLALAGVETVEAEPTTEDTSADSATTPPNDSDTTGEEAAQTETTEAE